MAVTKKSEKGRNRAGAGKKTSTGARPAKPGKKAPPTTARVIKRGRDHWRELVETSAAWIWKTDADIRHTYTNAFVTRCLGYQPAEFLSLNTLDLVHPDDRGLVNKLVQNAVTRKEGWYDQVLRWRHKDGSWRYIDSSGMALFDEQGAVTGLCGVDRDITEQKKADDARRDSEAALKQSEEKYRRLYNETPVLLHSIDRDARVVEVNDHWLQTLGYARDEVIGRKVTDFYTGVSSNYAQEVIHPAFFREGMVKDASYQFVKKNGDVVDVLLSATAERDAAGNVVRSQAVIVDITEQKRTEDLLRQSEARYRMLYEGTPVMMHSIDAEGKLVSVSDQWLTKLGYSREEVLGKRSTEFLDEQSSTYARTEVLPDFMRTGICTDVPYTFVKKNGERISTLLSAIAERDGSGKVVRSLAVIIDITERKKAESRMRESERKYRNLFESATDGVFIIDLDGNVIDANPIAYQRLGYTREEMLSLQIGKITSPEFAARVPDRMRQVREQGVVMFETGHLRKDGSVMPVEVNSRLLDYEGRSVLFSLVRDITERKRTEEKLKESEEKYKFLIETTKTGYVIIGGDGRVVDANEEYVRMSGHDKLDEILGRNVVEWTAAHDREHNAAEVKKCMKTGFVRNLEIDYAHKDGSFTPVEINATVTRTGDVVRIFTLCRDITERKRKDEALRESEAKYRAIFEGTAEGVALADITTHKLLYVNPAYCRMYGYTKEEVVRLGVEDLHPPQDVPRVLSEFEAQARGERILAPDLPCLRKDGSIFYADIKTTTTDIGGRTVVVGFFTDISERKKAAEEVVEQRAMLQQILDTSSVAIFLVDKTGRITRANRRMAEMFGQTMTELAGREYVELVHPSEREIGRAKMLALLASQIQSVDLERHYWRKDGTEFWGHLSGRRFYDVRGNELGLIGVISDITKRKRAEAELQDKENRYRLLFESANDGIFIQDSTGFFDCNQRGAEMYGLPKEKILGRSPAEFAPARQPDGRLSAEVAEEKSRSAMEGVPQVFEWQPLRADGTPFNVEITLSRLELGGSLYLQAIVRDITERKRVEDALRKSEKMLQTIIDAEPECVKLLDENANLIMMNRAGLDMLQVDSLDQVKGQCVCPLVTSEYREAFLDLTKRVFQGESGTLSFEMVGMKGRHLWMETRAVPLRNEKDEIIAVLGVTRDVTERKKAEDALRQSEARFRDIIESASVGILVVDVETRRIHYANPAICRLLGYSEQDFLSLTAMDLTVPEERQESTAGIPGPCRRNVERIGTDVQAQGRIDRHG